MKILIKKRYFISIFVLLAILIGVLLISPMPTYEYVDLPRADLSRIEHMALNGDENKIYTIFSTYIILDHNYTKAEIFFNQLSSKGYRDKAIEILNEIAEQDEFIQNKNTRMHLQNALESNNSVAQLMQTLIQK